VDEEEVGISAVEYDGVRRRGDRGDFGRWLDRGQ